MSKKISLRKGKMIQINAIFQLLLVIFLSVTVFGSMIKFTLNFKVWYYTEIYYLGIEKQSNLEKEEIMKNYNYVIDYLQNKEKEDFNLPSLPSSENGKIHFKEVKNIFLILERILWTTLTLSIFGIYIQCKKKEFNFIKQVSNMLCITPSILILIFIINFDTSFTIFHKIFFRNEYWIFNPNTDPIIRLLPQEFFLHSALMILILCIMSGVLLRIIYEKNFKIDNRVIKKHSNLCS
ncbi:TIGR01906 family membrane protein [Tepidibacter mesophilus]|uniref:TIGR01906 family membrane protein n=1 Tax=Tepidibacter mesophilus TaxID=655607 RepID=UPI000C08965C|nr:TIGR01906 family membrane protein [Tepidibacter mesophilus]